MRCLKCGEPGFVALCYDCSSCDVCGTKDNLIFDANEVVECMAHRAERIARQIAENAENPKDTDCTNRPVCPHCGYEMDPDSECMSDGVYSCDNCDREFEQSVEFSATFYTKKLEPAR